MFTGIIEKIGTVRSKVPRGSGVLLEVSTPERFELAPGDSVAVDGLCLTVTSEGPGGFTMDVSRESVERSTLKVLRVGGRVNLERALRIGDRVGGHLVTGHIDGVGKIADVKPESGFARITIAAPADVIALSVEKGSISLDGISLTVNGFQNDRFWVMVIPETLARTTLGAKRPGDLVNLESDLIGKYVARLLGQVPPANSDHLLRKLREEGFA